MLVLVVSIPNRRYSSTVKTPVLRVATAGGRDEGENLKRTIDPYKVNTLEMDMVTYEMVYDVQ
jgi:hypothetical protein